MSGKLYVVGTPIGNLEDITYRAVRILSEVDMVCAEDTRVTLKLLNHFDIKKPLVSCHEHITPEKIERIVQRIEAGETAAVVSDAGMPCISDPGYEVVKLCRDRGIPVEAVPGPAAVTTAAAVCGLPAVRFNFEGFLSVAKKQRSEHLKSVADTQNTLIFYEAPHKLRDTLADMLHYFGDRKIAICRELTKVHEEVIRTTLSQAIEYYETTSPKGEFVLVVEGSRKKQEAEMTLDEAVAAALELVRQGEKPTAAAKQAAKDSGYSRSEIYSRIAIQQENE